MSDIKKSIPFPGIIAVDLDGTLLKSDLTISDRTVEAFHRIREKGSLPVISTGRSYEAVVDIQKRLDLDTPIICYNGAMICDGRDGSVMHEMRLPSDIARGVLEETRKRDLHYQGFLKGQLYYEKKRPETEFYEAQTGLTGKVVNFDDWDVLEFTKVLLIAPPHRESRQWPELAQMQSFASEHFGNRVYTAYSKPFYLEMIHGESSKGHALKQLGEDFGVSREAIAAFGDGFNDLEMLSYAGISVAMGNAPQEVKQQTLYTTAGNDEDGIALFLEENFL